MTRSVFTASRIALLTTGVAALAMVTGVPAAAAPPTEESSMQGSAAQDLPRASVTVAGGKFQPFDADADALTYDEELVPLGAQARVMSFSGEKHGTTTVLIVRGLEPNREYGAHAHVNECGPTGDDAGPHYQDEFDPEQPSTDPEYANPDNEIWLDFTTNANGSAVATSQVDWTFDERRAGSVVIHEHHTLTEPGRAGEAGDRLGCLTVDF